MLEDDTENVSEIDISDCKNKCLKRSSVASEQDHAVPNSFEPTLEYDDVWESLHTEVETEEKHKFLMREFSFGEEQRNLKLTELLAPVFLAVAHDDDDDVALAKDKRTASIADFCTLTLHSDEASEMTHNQLNASHRQWYSQPSLNESQKLRRKFLYSEKSVLSSVSSCSTINRNMSTASDFYNESMDDSLEDEAILNVFVNNNMFDGNETEEKFNQDHMLDNNQYCTSSLKDFEQQVPGSPILYDILSDASMDGKQTPQFNDSSLSPCAFAHINTSPRADSSSRKIVSKYIVVSVCGEKRLVDTSLMKDHLKLLSHGGYRKVNGKESVILVFNAAYLPILGENKYHIRIEQLFFYCVHAIELLVKESYEIVFFNSQMKSSNIPPMDFLKKCYNTINYRLKKNLQNVYFVHQNTWLKVLLKISQLFASSKFRRKVRIVKNLAELKELIPLDYIFISPEIYKIDRQYQS